MLGCHALCVGQFVIIVGAGEARCPTIGDSLELGSAGCPTRFSAESLTCAVGGQLDAV